MLRMGQSARGGVPATEGSGESSVAAGLGPPKPAAALSNMSIDVRPLQSCRQISAAPRVRSSALSSPSKEMRSVLFFSRAVSATLVLRLFVACGADKHSKVQADELPGY